MQGLQTHPESCWTLVAQALSVNAGARHVWVVGGATLVLMQHTLAVRSATPVNVRLLRGGSVCPKRLQQVHNAAQHRPELTAQCGTCYQLTDFLLTKHLVSA